MHNIILFLEGSLFIYASFLVGSFILNTVKAKVTLIQHIVFGILLGYGFWGIVGLILGLVGMFDANILRIVLALILIASFKSIHSHILRFKTSILRKLVKAFFEENTILNEPTCKADKPTKLFLMRINELPQIKDKAIR